MKYRFDEVLARLDLKQPVVGAEIGISTGGMSAQLLRPPLLTLYMVDFWGGNPGVQRYAKENTAFAGDRAKIVYAKSLEAAPRFADKFFDFVFIDADHSEQAVRDDIAAWRPKIKDGGLLCGHDYKSGLPRNAGVDVAVDEFVKATWLKLETGDDSTWFVRLP
jgi:predicted O-methyltransferase YrrM